MADDGAADSTRQLVERHARNFPVPLRHAWHWAVVQVRPYPDVA